MAVLRQSAKQAQKFSRQN